MVLSSNVIKTMAFLPHIFWDGKHGTYKNGTGGWFIIVLITLPSGKLLHSYGKSPLFM